MATEVARSYLTCRRNAQRRPRGREPVHGLGRLPTAGAKGIPARPETWAMHLPQSLQFPRAIRLKRSAWAGALVVTVAVTYAVAAHHTGPPTEARVPPATPLPVSTAGPVTAQVITSQATDRYTYLADVLGQLNAHPHAACRDEVAGPQGMQDELAQARALQNQGRTQDATAMLAAVENRLDRKFKMECLKLG